MELLNPVRVNEYLINLFILTFSKTNLIYQYSFTFVHRKKCGSWQSLGQGLRPFLVLGLLRPWQLVGQQQVGQQSGMRVVVLGQRG